MTHGSVELLGDVLLRHGISRRSFIKYCTAAASTLALPPGMGAVMAEQLRQAPRPSVVYLSFQECTGCLESLTRSFSPTIESLIFNTISLDYDDTLMAAAGEAAEAARTKAMKDNFGKYVLVVDGSVPTGAGGGYCTAGGRSSVDILREAAKGAAAIVCGGTCAAFGGIPLADPNPGQRNRGRQAHYQRFRLSAHSGSDHRNAIAIRHHGKGAGSGRTSSAEGLFRQHHS
jgi:hydrogenase small subunit